MKLKAEEEKLLRQFIAASDDLLGAARSRILGPEDLRNRHLKYVDLKQQLINLLNSSTERESKWKQIDLEEAIKNEKNNHV